NVCLDLGVFYLDENRLDDAEKLFRRLDKFERPPSYHVLGHFGLAIVQALRDQPQESNRLFVESFKKLAELRAAKPPKGRPLGAGKPPPDPALQQLQPNPSGRYWLSKARWFNRKNGEDVPPPYRGRIPLPPEAPAKRGG